MNYSVYLRPLELSDAKVSYKWRNNPLIWKYTEFKPSEYITKAIETVWLKRVLKSNNEHRFAICLKENDKYLGNIQLIDIKNRNAQFHIFIGETSFWGRGIAKEATKLLLNYGFTNLGLKLISLKVHKENLSAQSVYKKIGFQTIGEEGHFIEMNIPVKHYLQNLSMEYNEVEDKFNKAKTRLILGPRHPAGH